MIDKLEIAGLSFIAGIIFSIVLHAWAKSKGKVGMDFIFLPKWWKD